MDTHHLDSDPDAGPDSTCHPNTDPDADPDSTYHPDAVPDPDPSFPIKAQTIEKIYKLAQILTFWLVICKLMRIRMRHAK
jgi:hypothetical protein